MAALNEARRPAVRFHLWHVLLAVAVLAVLFAALGVVVATVASGVLALLALPVVRARRGRKLEALAWVCAVYPWIVVASFYVTWLTAWAVFGHRPRAGLDDPKWFSQVVMVPYIANALLMRGGLAAVPVTFTVFLARALQEIWRAAARRRAGALPDSLATRRLALLMFVLPAIWGIGLSFLHSGAFELPPNQIFVRFFD